ncbi:hypothetical protein ACJZL1_02430 [Wolbachia endosymbiont of Rhagoletis indifferens]|uniref:hypothetical protein n=1 Tax=Wolbachia endosymbiont of Rhagoletis indifferens TaxID=3383250 RepID=UPI003AF35D0D
MPFFSFGKFLNIYSNMNKHLRVTSASRVSSQCVTLGWLCCIATEKIWWLLTKFIINNHLTVEEKICHRK